MSMSNYKFKSLLVASVISCTGFADQAYGQISVEDRDAGVLLEDIRDDARDAYEATDNFRDEDVRPHYESQIEHYDREIARLNAMIQSLGYYSVDGESDPSKRAGREAIFTPLDQTTNARVAVQAAAEGESTEFGIVIDGFDGGGGISGGSGPSAFRTEFGLGAPSTIYEDNEQSQKNLTRKYSSLYFANTVAGESNIGREGRLKVYNDLLEEAKSAEDLQATMRIQNAILLENGRNLALLIDLQTAQLNSQTVTMMESATNANAPGYMFGAGASLGDAVFAGIVEAIQ